MAKPPSSRFFRDLPGRDDGMFMSKSGATALVNGQAGNGASGAAPGAGDGSGKLNVGATGAPMGGTGFRGTGMGGGMYGTGGGVEEGAEDVGEESYGTGKGKGGQRGKSLRKTSSASPTDWDADTSLPTGFHRPAKLQPEELEAGGERFHSTEDGTVIPPSNRQRHGLVEGGSMTLRATSSPQMGKHASVGVSRFMGTSYGIEKSAGDNIPSYYHNAPKSSPGVGGWASQRADEFTGSLGRAGSGVLNTLGEGVKSVTRSPAAAVIATLIGGRMALGGGKRLVGAVTGKKARLAAAAAAAAKAKAAKGGLLSGLMGGARSALSKVRHFATK